MLDAEIVRCCGRARLPISWYQIGGGLTVNWTDPSILWAAIGPLKLDVRFPTDC